MRHGTHINEWGHTHECVTSHAGCAGVGLPAYENVRRSHRWGMVHISMSGVIHMNVHRVRSCGMWISHGTHQNEWNHTYECVTSKVRMKWVQPYGMWISRFEWVASHAWLKTSYMIVYICLYVCICINVSRIWDQCVTYMPAYVSDTLRTCVRQKYFGVAVRHMHQT